MAPYTAELHRSLIRAIRMALAAWEHWLDAAEKRRAERVE
jgi:hypothetical protein